MGWVELVQGAGSVYVAYALAEYSWLARLVLAYVFCCAASEWRKPDPQPTTPEQFAEAGLGPATGAKRGRSVSASALPPAAALYLDTLKRSLCGMLYEDVALIQHNAQTHLLQVTDTFDLGLRMGGEDCPEHAHTMVGWKRLCNVQDCVERVVQDQVPGDLIETGVARGGACVLMRGCLEAMGDSKRRVIACDTFAGTPPCPLFVRLFIFPLIKLFSQVPLKSVQMGLFHLMEQTQKSFPISQQQSEEWVSASTFLYHHAERSLRLSRGTSLPEVRATFARYGLLDSRVLFLEGFFSSTLPLAVESGDVRELALLRLDGDMYESTMDALGPLYPKLSPGGFVIVDDYYSYKECAKAVDEYREQHGITEPLMRIDRLSCYWRKAPAGGKRAT